MNARILTKFWSLLSVLLVLSLVAAPAAFADTLDADFVNSTNIVVKTSPGAQVTITAPFKITYQTGQNVKHLSSNQTLTLYHDPTKSLTGFQTLPSGSAPNVQITIPSNWTTGIIAKASSTITLTAPDDLGTYRYYGKWEATSYSCVTSPCLTTGSAWVKIELVVTDLGGPTIEIVIPDEEDTFVLHQYVEAEYYCSDDLSEVTSCVGSIVDFGPVDNFSPLYTGSLGLYDFLVMALDQYGNTSSLTHTYSVIYDFAGFFAPVDNLDEYGNPILNKVKAGSAIPVKFSLAGDQGMGILTSGPTSVSIACEAGSATAAVEETVSSTSSHLNYDPVEDQYIYVWKTDKSWSNSCRRFSFTLQDGTTHTADFQFTK